MTRSKLQRLGTVLLVGYLMVAAPALIVLAALDIFGVASVPGWWALVLFGPALALAIVSVAMLYGIFAIALIVETRDILRGKSQ